MRRPHCFVRYFVMLLLVSAAAGCSARQQLSEEPPEQYSAGGTNLELRRCQLASVPSPVVRQPVTPGRRIALGSHEVRFSQNVPPGALITLTPAPNNRVGFQLELEANDQPVQFTDTVEIRVNMAHCLPQGDETWSIWRITPDSAVLLPTTRSGRTAIARTDRHSGFVLARQQS